MLRIDLRALEIGHHEFNLESTTTELGLDSVEMESIRADVHLHYDGRQALVIVDASAIASLDCDRTLVRYKQPIRGSYTVLFSPDEPDEEAEDEVRPFAASDEEIDITDVVRDTLLLAIPIRKIAPGAEDAEIVTTFGVSPENMVDPRWAALSVLKEDAESKDLQED